MLPSLICAWFRVSRRCRDIGWAAYPASGHFLIYIGSADHTNSASSNQANRTVSRSHNRIQGTVSSSASSGVELQVSRGVLSIPGGIMRRVLPFDRYSTPAVTSYPWCCLAIAGSHSRSISEHVRGLSLVAQECHGSYVTASPRAP
jgi:hypothetical protein